MIKYSKVMEFCPLMYLLGMFLVWCVDPDPVSVIIASIVYGFSLVLYMMRYILWRVCKK